MDSPTPPPERPPEAALKLPQGPPQGLVAAIKYRFKYWFNVVWHPLQLCYHNNACNCYRAPGIVYTAAILCLLTALVAHTLLQLDKARFIDLLPRNMNEDDRVDSLKAFQITFIMAQLLVVQLALFLFPPQIS